MGKKAELEYIGLENKEEEVPEEPEAEAPEEDDFDFNERFTSLKSEFAEQLKEEAILNKRILENLEKVKLIKE